VLARLTDLGWGGTMRELFAAGAADGPASPAMIAACVRVLAEWGWEERPTAIVTVPSRRHPQLIESVATGLSTAGRLPHLGSLDYLGQGPTGEPGGNSAYRLAGVWDRLTVPAGLAEAMTAARGPVLLIDDLVDSRWTLTVAARELRLAGATAVLPFALAVSG
jgi:ATP-dependent DNA helicase RecQ